ncbi:matrix protein VP40 [Striga asiatica]|uniref:Matrix protein VP40 n=1 Tax=Striga asiatica TaxID=4170 RepID=A0A5A7R763_STRAF|nr:matrix protein VP40 [Striga asiatica]
MQKLCHYFTSIQKCIKKKGNKKRKVEAPAIHPHRHHSPSSGFCLRHCHNHPSPSLLPQPLPSPLNPAFLHPIPRLQAPEPPLLLLLNWEQQLSSHQWPPQGLLQLLSSLSEWRFPRFPQETDLFSCSPDSDFQYYKVGESIRTKNRKRGENKPIADRRNALNRTTEEGLKLETDKKRYVRDLQRKKKVIRLQIEGESLKVGAKDQKFLYANCCYGNAGYDEKGGYAGQARANMMISPGSNGNYTLLLYEEPHNQDFLKPNKTSTSIRPILDNQDLII